MKISIATNLAPDYLGELLESKEKHATTSEIEVFGAFPGYKSALDRFYDENVSLDDFRVHVRKALSEKLNFNYLLNSLLVKPESLRGEIEEILSLGIRTVTVSQVECIDFLMKNYPELKVVVSIIHATKSEQEIENLSHFPNVKRIILDQSVNHNFPLLLRLVKKSKSLGITTELLANELCYSECPIREKHYASDSCYTHAGVNYGNICGIMKDKDIISKSPWIRPEDLGIYEKLGIDYIKLAWRNTPTKLLIDCFDAYLKRTYDGNFFDIMDLDGKRVEVWGREDKRHLSNRKLDNYLLYMFKSQISWQ